MELDNMNEDWKKEAPKLAAMEVSNPFTVPGNYFEELSEQLKARIRIEEDVVKDSSTIFSVPANYFDTLEERIHQAVLVEGLKDEVKGEGFTVPEGYFDSLESRIFKKTILADQPKEEAKVRKFAPASWIRYAAAACITVAIGLGIYSTQNKGTEEIIQTKLAEVPDSEIVNYLQEYSAPGDGEIIAGSFGKNVDLSTLNTELSDKEIENYLETTF